MLLAGAQPEPCNGGLSGGFWGGVPAAGDNWWFWVKDPRRRRHGGGGAESHPLKTLYFFLEKLT